VLWEGISMIDIEQFFADPSKYVWGNDCKINVDSIFASGFNGDLKLLLTCCEDNATFDEINYHQAVADYKRSLGRD